MAYRLLGLHIRVPPGTWMFVLCVVRKDKWQNTGKSRKRNKYG
jgi:hypothetical protein